jgi:DNA repair exonuclease SbcCD ATPase subunit
MIIDLLQMDFATFTNSVMFGQGVSKMFSSATDAEQKKILENMLQIDIYKACQDLAKKYVKDIESSINAVNNQLSLHLNQQKTTKDMLEHAQEKEAKLEQQVNDRIAELEDEWTGYNQELQTLPDIMSLQDEADSYKSLINKLDDKINSFKEHEDTLNDLVAEKKSLQREIQTHSKEMDRKREELADLQSGKNVPKTCEMCGQDLPLEDTTHIENHIKEAIRKAGMDWQFARDELQETEQLIQKVYALLAGKSPLEKQREELASAIRQIESEMVMSVNREKQIAVLQERILKQIDEQRALLGTTYAEMIEKTISMLDDLKVRIEGEQEEIDKLTSEKSRYEFWVNGYSNQGIKSVLLDSVTPFLNTQANHYLNVLADSTIEVKFNTQTETAKGEKKDKFSVGVKNENGDDNYEGNSGGEKRRIDVAVNMALQDLVLSRSNKRLDFIVYDEVFEGLDAIGSEKVIHLLQEKAKKCGTIFVITHNDSLKQLFSKSLVVRKENGRTVIENGDD